LLEKYSVDPIDFYPQKWHKPIHETFPRGEAMQKERMRCILSGIKRFELTAAEAEFIAFVEGSVNPDGPLMKFMELILEGLYSRKTEFIRDSIVSMLKQEETRFHPACT
jgi:hypothetical protein